MIINSFIFVDKVKCIFFLHTKKCTVNKEWKIYINDLRSYTKREHSMYTYNVRILINAILYFNMKV